MFLMVDEDHSGFVDKEEYNTLICNFSTSPDADAQPMNQEQFTKRIIETQDPKKVMKWWWNQSNFSRSLNTTVQMLLLVHTPVTRMVFQYFNCNPVHNKSFLKADYSIECLSSKWNMYLVFVLVIGGAFTIGFPFAMAVYIRWHRHELHTAKIQSRIGFLYSNYTNNAEFWEVHEIVRKTLLTGVIIYLQTRPTTQASVAVIICLVACCTLNYFEPQKNRVVFWLAQLSFIITSIKFLSAIVLIAAKHPTERQSIGSLLIALDVVFFIGSITGTILAIYILWNKIKEISKMKPGSSKIVPAGTDNVQLLKVKRGSAQDSDSRVNNTRIAEAQTINEQGISTVNVNEDLHDDGGGAAGTALMDLLNNADVLESPNTSTEVLAENSEQDLAVVPAEAGSVDLEKNVFSVDSLEFSRRARMERKKTFGRTRTQTIQL